MVISALPCKTITRNKSGGIYWSQSLLLMVMSLALEANNRCHRKKDVVALEVFAMSSEIVPLFNEQCIPTAGFDLILHFISRHQKSDPCKKSEPSY